MKPISRKDAKKKGLKRYFTGVVCPNGHMSERRVSSYCCIDCAVMHAKKPKAKAWKKAYHKNQKKINGVMVAKYHREYYELHREKHIKRARKFRSNPVNFNKFSDSLLGCECRPDANGNLEVRCKKCNTFYLPIYTSVRERIKAINGMVHSLGAENHLYCSDKCKNECDLYHAITIPKSQRHITTKLRCNQSTNRKSLMDIQTDTYGYNFCEKCGTKSTKLDIHHSIMVSKDRREIDNMAHQILLCTACHKSPEAHCRE